MRNYLVNEGTLIGGQEPQALGATQNRFKASADIVKGQPLEITGAWTVGPASADSAKYCGIADMDAVAGEVVTFRTEGWIKLDASNAVIADGDDLVCAGTGKVKSKGASAGTVIGKAYVGCAANGVAYAKLR